MNVGMLLFDDFETLDVFGPVEVLGRLKKLYTVAFYSLQGGVVKNEHGINILSEPLEDIKSGVDIFLIPGGRGTRAGVDNMALLTSIRSISEHSVYVLTVCTGSALLAKTGLLDNKKATSNKKSFDWVAGLNDKVIWMREARWTVDGKYYTSAGVSAGIDMTLGFLADRHGEEFARKVAVEIEYAWQEDKDHDRFSNI